MYDEIKVTQDNIVELSQFKVGDTVTLLKKIETDEGIYLKGNQNNKVQKYKNINA